jgi:PKD repeat protein
VFHRLFSRAAIAAVFVYSFSLASAAHAATYQVGVTRQYTTLRSLPTLAPGDVVEIDSGTYSEARIWSVDGTETAPITIRGVGATRPVIDGTGVNVEGSFPHPRALFQIEGRHHVIENLEFRNARNSTFNGSGIRVLGSVGTTIRNCRLVYNDMGMQANYYTDLLLESNEVAYNGRTNPYVVAHNLYFGQGQKLTLRYNYVHDALSGINVKTRAHYVELLYNYIADSNEGEVSLVDSPTTASPDSNVLMLGNIVVSKANRYGNAAKFIHFGSELGNGHTGTLYLVNNTFVAGAGTNLFVWVGAAGTAEAYNNVFYGSNHIIRTGTAISGADNWVRTNADVPSTLVGTIRGTDPGFVDVAARNYHLTAAAQARDAAIGGAPSYRNGDSVPLSAHAAMEYVAHLSGSARPSDGLLDIGAYEHDPNTLPPPPPPPPDAVPVARITATPTSGTAPLTVSLNGSASSDAEGPVARYAWNFGDGTSATGAAVSHVFSAGTYTVKLTVTDSAGQSATASVTITVTSSSTSSGGHPGKGKPPKKKH